MSLIQKEINAFKYASQGIKAFLIKEDHGKFHLFATLIVIPFIFILPTNSAEKALLFIIIALVWALEMLNSAIEKTLDIISVKKIAEIKYVKDVMAGAVLISSICSVVIGAIVLLPKLYNYVF